MKIISDIELLWLWQSGQAKPRFRKNSFGNNDKALPPRCGNISMLSIATQPSTGLEPAAIGKGLPTPIKRPIRNQRKVCERQVLQKSHERSSAATVQFCNVSTISMIRRHRSHAYADYGVYHERQPSVIYGYTALHRRNNGRLLIRAAPVGRVAGR